MAQSVSTNSSGTGSSETDAQDVEPDNSVPTNIDLVDDKLYLGNLAAACDIPLLEKYQISHILTIDSCPLPAKITHLPFVKTKFIQLCDIPREDILHHFEDTYEFLRKAVEDKDGRYALVHCYFGVSRSATIVLAYMMRKYEISLEDAQDRLKSRRSVIGPNYGFLSQLKLYEKMKFSIDKNNIFYKRFRLHVAADKVKSVKLLAPPFTDVIKKDPALHTVRPEPVVYRCKKCRRVLASASNLLTHREKKSPLWFDFQGEEDASEMGSPICAQMFFIEPITWMSNVAQSLQGKLHCPNQNCKSKLGSFSWVMGCVCPCGAKVQPAFYLVPSKVDRSTSVLNFTRTVVPQEFKRHGRVSRVTLGGIRTTGRTGRAQRNNLTKFPRGIG
ncbi:unnamed protein product [Allacma fusca]|uniref:Protein-tyrosine-phosphatase n=1 Tax=Allacma fusca TaxID=39272 RepID=A0A8J2L8K0_9HEXA|nr:unnamed protein product [Allacma fusca]